MGMCVHCLVTSSTTRIGCFLTMTAINVVPSKCPRQCPGHLVQLTFGEQCTQFPERLFSFLREEPQSSLGSRELSQC